MAGSGGAWKVAYADFVTAMMAFFLVMWITAQNKPVKEAIAQYFNNPFGDPKGSTSTRAGFSEDSFSIPGQTSQRPPGSRTGAREKGKRGQGRAEAKTMEETQGPHAKRPTVFVVHDGKRSGVGTIVTFPELTAELDEQGKARLKELIPVVRGKPNKIEIRGHTSGRPLPTGGPYKDSWQLAYARCQATMKYLADNGIEPERMRLSQAAANEPISIRAEPELQAGNSRVEIYLLGEFVDEMRGTPKERAHRTETTDADTVPEEAASEG